MRDSLKDTAYRLATRYPRLDPQLVINQLVSRPSIGCLDLMVQKLVEGSFSGSAPSRFKEQS